MAAAEHALVVRRTARWYTIGEIDGATDVWFVLHGYGQLAARFVEAFQPIAAAGRVVVAPEGLSRFYLDPLEQRRGTSGRVGATWMTREDRLHEIGDYVAYLDQLAALVLGRAAPRARVRVLGFSQGVATATRWLARGEVRAHDVVLWAGGVAPEVGWAGEEGRRAAGERLALVVGTRDELVPADAVDEQLAVIGPVAERARVVRYDGGHRIDAETLKRLADD